VCPAVGENLVGTKAQDWRRPETLLRGRERETGTKCIVEICVDAIFISSLRCVQNINRLMYHAKQRGWLELDLIIGQWAEKNLQSLSSEELKDFEELLGCENPDLFKYLTNQMEAGEDLKHNKAFQVR
jgi:succinate dehydrogenase flavin-adding protein (antitoxin of CptAB toxin-antitoxin module)